MPRDWRELEEDELHELEEAEDEVPRSWRPDLDTIRAIEGEESAEQKADHIEKPPRADKMIERMMERKGKADLTKPGAWGRFAHAAIQDAVQQAEPSAEVEKTVNVVKDDGTLGKGRIDVLTKDGILEIKTTNLNRFSNSELVRELEDIARQVEGYQWSPDIEGKPEAAVLFEFAPKTQERQEFVEAFFQRRGIRVMWGKD